jgi:glycosyltransferase involved in cell wall biosynthesis
MAAMSMGKAIISCQGDMTDDSLFREGENIVFVPYGDAAEYYNAMQRLLQDAGLREALGNSARRTYEESCNWQVIARRITSRM